MLLSLSTCRTMDTPFTAEAAPVFQNSISCQSTEDVPERQTGTQVGGMQSLPYLTGVRLLISFLISTCPAQA